MDGDLRDTVDKNTKTYYKLRNNVIQLAIQKFKAASGFECSVGMMELSILSLKTELYDYKLLSDSYKTMAQIFDFQEALITDFFTFRNRKINNNMIDTYME